MNKLKKITLFTFAILIVIAFSIQCFAKSIDERYYHRTPLILVNDSILSQDINIIDYHGLFFMDLNTLAYLSDKEFIYSEDSIYIYPSENTINLKNSTEKSGYVKHKKINLVFSENEIINDVKCIEVNDNIYIPFTFVSEKLQIKYLYLNKGSQIRFYTDIETSPKEYKYIDENASMALEHFNILFNSDINPPLIVNNRLPDFSVYNYYNWDNLIKPTITYAYLNSNTDKFLAGDKVVILEDTGNGTNYRISKDGIEEWVLYNVLDFIPMDFTLNEHELSKLQIETYINNQDFKSATPYLIWVDISRQRTYILKKDNTDEFKLIRNELCTTGNNVTITVRGEFEVLESNPPTYYARGTWFFGNQVNMGAKYWVKFYKNYMFHSITYLKDATTIADSELGQRNSHGCIRLKTETAKWIYENINPGTKIYIN